MTPGQRLLHHLGQVVLNFQQKSSESNLACLWHTGSSTANFAQNRLCHQARLALTERRENWSNGVMGPETLLQDAFAGGVDWGEGLKNLIWIDYWQLIVVVFLDIFFCLPLQLWQAVQIYVCAWRIQCGVHDGPSICSSYSQSSRFASGVSDMPNEGGAAQAGESKFAYSWR